MTVSFLAGFGLGVLLIVGLTRIRLPGRNPELERYLGLRYRIVIEPFSEEEGGGYEAFIPTLGKSTCVAVGDTEEEALDNLLSVKRDVMESWYKEGLPIPLPKGERE